MLFLNNWKGETMSKAQRVVGTKAQRVVGTKAQRVVDTKAQRVVDTKAQIVVDTYDEIYAENASSNACYDEAYAAVRYQGGIEICNSNNMLASCILSTPNQTFKLPNRIFKFDDGSYVIVTCTGARILTEVDLDDKS